MLRADVMPLHVSAYVISPLFMATRPDERERGFAMEAVRIADATQVQDETVRTLIACLNEATAAIAPWPLPGQPIAKE